ncbi:MAG: hypothetical protein MMC23_007915 [Stictis urceolatum]|nr:hypothetical protein [Stictis urceolata]
MSFRAASHVPSSDNASWAAMRNDFTSLAQREIVYRPSSVLSQFVEDFKPIRMLPVSKWEIEPGKFLEVNKDVRLTDKSFLRIKMMHLEQGEEGERRVRLDGWSFKSAGSDPAYISKQERGITCDDEDLCQLVPAHQNEVCWSIKFVANEEMSINKQAIQSAYGYEVLEGVKVILTNHSFPKYNSYMEIEGYKNRDLDPRHFPLVCRWKTVRSWPSRKARKQGAKTHCTKRVERITEQECDYGCTIPASLLMKNHRGLTNLFGSQEGVHEKEDKRRQWEAAKSEETFRILSGVMNEAQDRTAAETITIKDEETPEGSSHQRPIVVIDDCAFDMDWILIEDDDSLALESDEMWVESSRDCEGGWKSPEVRRYSLADVFCGAGGVSRAAVNAGIYPAYGVDVMPQMCHTWIRNNPGSRISCSDVFDFLGKPGYANKQVDIVHISNPCQTFSKAHTTDGKNDEANARCVHCIEEFVRQAKPRIVTIENADGLYNMEKNKNYFCMVVKQFIILGYSIEARVVHFANYGVAQPRARLVLIAACPGQRLPGCPQPTHTQSPSPGSNLLPWITEREAVSAIPIPWIDHDPTNMKLIDNKEESSGDKIGRTLLTQNRRLHHEGWRRYTIRELACLQSFPLHHEFGHGQSERQKEKQIGNAVPPAGFAKILSHIRLSLEEDDRQEERRRSVEDQDVRRTRKRLWSVALEADEAEPCEQRRRLHE